MRLTVIVNDREALPVRAIPFVTGWNMSPDMVATGLAHTDEAKRLKGVFAHRIVDNEIVAVMPKHWDAIKVALAGLDELLPTSNAGYAEWRDKSPSLLPEGVFVWLDDFSVAYGKAFSANNWICDEREGERELDLVPMIGPSAESIVMAGFICTELLNAEHQPVNESAPTSEPSIGVIANSTIGPLKVYTNDTKKRRHALDPAIDFAVDEHGLVAAAVWTELTSLAISNEKRFPFLIGITEEGIQYLGKRHQNDLEYDILTRKQLGERIRKRRLKHPKPP